MPITIVSGSGDKGRTTLINLATSASVKELKKEFAKSSGKSIHRISFKLEGENAVRLDDDSKSLDSYGVKEGTKILFKDLGAQIGYRLVFLLEYFGPIVFVLFYSVRPAFIYGVEAAKKEYDWVARLGVICWTLHFLKREYETLFVHKFSRPTMPLSNLFKNCAYYWSFGAVIGYPLCSPGFVAPSETQVYVGLGIFILSELGNLICHLMLSNMRPSEGDLSCLYHSYVYSHMYTLIQQHHLRSFYDSHLLTSQPYHNHLTT